MPEIDPIFLKLDGLICTSRLNELALLLSTDRPTRIVSMMAALQQLRPGAYLLGTGPSTTGIVPLTVDEVVLGRTATPVETPADSVIDYGVADTLFFGPREASRVHAKIVREKIALSFEYRVFDLGSSFGTFVNGEPVPAEGTVLGPGDVLSLGPTQVNIYLFYVVGRDGPDAPHP